LEHPEKHPWPSFVTEEGIVTSVRLEHPLKQSLGSSVTESEIVNLTRSLSPGVTDPNSLICLKVSFPVYVADLPIDDGGERERAGGKGLERVVRGVGGRRWGGEGGGSGGGGRWRGGGG
jgi:hypothetical protein